MKDFFAADGQANDAIGSVNGVAGIVRKNETAMANGVVVDLTVKTRYKSYVTAFNSAIRCKD